MNDVPTPTPQLHGAVDLSSLVHPPGQAGQAGQSGEAATGAPGQSMQVPSLLMDGTDANFAQFLEVSKNVPVIVDLWAEWCEPCKKLSPVLEKVIRSSGGRLILVRVDVDSNPQLKQAFQAQSIPTVAAIIGGRPVSLFSGTVDEQQVRQVFDQVLELAAQSGVTGTAVVESGESASADDPSADAGQSTTQEAVEEELPPHHAEAYAAIERGDYDQAISEYNAAIAQNPSDRAAVAGLAQVTLLARLQNITADELRSAAASAPDDAGAQLGVADLDVSGGHVDDAFDRLLAVFGTLDADGKDTVRQRLLEYFEIVGVDDPRVTKARARLSALLY